jgi:diguanylate cyclase (GGDEF)-like protein/PAS domain S-box-containing protein
MSFRIKLFITFIVYGSFLALTTQLFVLKLNERSIKKEAITQAVVFANNANNNFNKYIQGITQRLHTIEDSKLFFKLFEDKEHQEFVNQLFLDITKNTPNIMQIRFIDIEGNEKNRIDRESIGSVPYIISTDKLQNKKDRYYFQEITKLNKSQFWYSKIDLNMEHGEIEKPVKPVLRIGTPLFYKGEKVGILIINVFMKDFLSKMTQSNSYNVYLLDKDAYLMLGPTDKYSWNRYLKQEVDFPLEFKADITKILHKEKVYADSYYAQKIDIQGLDPIYLIVVPDILNTQEKMDENFEKLLWILLTVILLSLPLSYYLAISPSKLKQEVDELNENMRNEVLQRDVLLSLFDLSDSVLFKWNNDENWSVSSVSKSVKSLLGYSKRDFETSKIHFSECIYKDDLIKVIEEVNEAIETKKYFFTHKPYRVVTRVGEIRWILDHTVIVRDKNDNVINYVGYLSDITEIKEKEFMLQELARTDQLTQIYNRVYLDELLNSQHYRYKRNEEPCSVILLDIDYFKLVNDKFGHIVGDKILVTFAKILKSAIRESDVVGRWGGEEFLIVLPHTTIDKAALLAEKLRKEIEENVFVTVGSKTASFGVSCFSEGVSIEKLIDNVDRALYEAKESGRNNVKVYKEK